MIILYDCATAPSPRRARILLAEKGIAHETVQVDLVRGEQLGEAYRAINPQCTVPALRTDDEDGLLLTDNAAIAAWVEARYPQPPLMGITPREKAEIASWNWRIEFEGLLAIAETLRNSSPAMADRALPGVARRKLYTLQWASMLVLLYLAEGVVRGMTDAGLSASLAWLEALLALAFFVCALGYVAPFKRTARMNARAKKS